MTMTSARFEFRLRQDTKELVERAAALLHQSTSDFARAAIEERAERVLQEHQLLTVVPLAYFDDLLRSLDLPAEPNPALRKAAKRARGIVRRG